MNNVDRVMASINSKYGVGTICLAQDAANLVVKRFSTGSYALDLTLQGGWAEGRCNQLAGQFSSYKSTMATISGQRFIDVDPDSSHVIWIDVEKSWDGKYAKKLGADLTKFCIATPSCAEECVDIVCGTVKEAKAGKRVLIVVDSIAAMTPQIEIDALTEKQQVGAHPRLVGKMCRKAISAMRSNLQQEIPPVTMLLLNQVRMQIGVMWGDPENLPGGKNLEHTCSVIVKLRKKQLIREKKTQEGVASSKTFGADVGFTIVKNKTGEGSNDTGMFRFYNRDYGYCKGGSVDNALDLLPLGIQSGVISRSKTTYSYRKISEVGKDNFCKALQAKTKTMQRLFKEILAEQTKGNEVVEEKEEKHGKLAF